MTHLSSKYFHVNNVFINIWIISRLTIFEIHVTNNNNRQTCLVYSLSNLRKFLQRTETNNSAPVDAKECSVLIISIYLIYMNYVLMHCRCIKLSVFQILYFVLIYLIHMFQY